MIPAYCLFAVVGRPFANTIRMILIIIQMKVFSEKRRELSQSIASLSGSMTYAGVSTRCSPGATEKI